MPESKKPAKLYNTPTSPDNAFSVFWEPDKDNAKLKKKQTSLNKKCTIFSKDSIMLWKGGRGWLVFGERNKIPINLFEGKQAICGCQGTYKYTDMFPKLKCFSGCLNM